MPTSIIKAAGVLALLLGAIGAARAGEARRILVDGHTRDWKGVRVAEVDPSGDAGSSGPDLRRLWLANDEDFLYLRLELGDETILQNSLIAPLGNDQRIYLDADGSRATGLLIHDVGADIEIRLGEREFHVHEVGGLSRTITPGKSGMLSLPTHSSKKFEIAIAMRLGGGTDFTTSLRDGREIELVIASGGSGDRLPDNGAVSYRSGTAVLEPLEPISLDREPGQTVRVLSLNVEDSLIARQPKRYRRLLRALRPDIIMIQSLLEWDAEATRDFVASALPLEGNRDWRARQAADCVTVSSFPIVDSAPVDGNLVAYLDLPDQSAQRDLVLFNVHLPCCENDAGRDDEVDKLMVTWRELLAGDGPFTIDPDDAMVLGGDLNLVGFRHQLEALLKGKMIDPANEPNFDPGRSKGALEDALLRHTHVARTHTWRRSTSAFTPGRLDFVIFTGDALELTKGFVLDTSTMPKATRKSHKLRKKDSVRVSDHLVLVADLELD